MRASLGWILMAAGSGWMLLSTIGLHRMRTSMARMQVAGKAGTFGVVSCLVGAALVVDDPAGSARLAIAALVLLLTTPAATQALAQSHLPEAADDAEEAVPAGRGPAETGTAED